MLNENRKDLVRNILNNFKKDDILQKFFETSHNVPVKEDKKVIINQAITILWEQFSDLEELVLFLSLKRLVYQKRDRNWTPLEIKDAKRFSKQSLSHQKISQTMLKYFYKYDIPCKLYSEMTNNCIWIALFLENEQTRPIFIVVHMELYMVFLSYMVKHQPITEKIIRKTFRGTDIRQLQAINASVHYIQNLKSFPKQNIRSLEVKKRKPTKRNVRNKKSIEIKIRKTKKRSRVLSTTESECEELIEENQKKTEPQKGPRNREPPELQKRESVETQNSFKRRLFTDPQRTPNKRESLQTQKAPSIRESPQSQKAPRESPEPQKRESLETQTSFKRRLFTETSKKRESLEPHKALSKKKSKEHRKDARKEPHYAPQRRERESLETHNYAREKLFREPQKTSRKRKSPESQKPTKKKKFTELQKVLEERESSKPQKSSREKKSAGFKRQNFPVTKNLTYVMKSSLSSGEEKNSNLSVSVVKFHGENVLNGLKSMCDSGVADGPLPDYLCKAPISGKTEFVVTL